MPKKWEFVASPSFWAMVGLAVTAGLWQDGIIKGGLATTLTIIFSGFYGHRSIAKGYQAALDILAKK
jgi:hypothetical protein